MPWTWWALQIGTPIVALIGVTGNILSFLVLKSKRYRYKSYSHYLCTLAVFDSFVLVFKYIKRLNSLLWHTGHDGIFAEYGDAACKIHQFAEHVCFLMSSWIVLCMTLERYIAVNFPFKKDVFCRPRNALTTIFVVFALLSYSQIFRLIVIEKSDEDNMCGASTKYRKIYIAMHIYLYQFVLQFMLPAVLILILNMVILWKVHSLKEDISKHGNVHSVRAYSKRNKTTCMLLIISFTYIVTLLPLVLVSITLDISAQTNKRLAIKLFRRLYSPSQILELISEVNYAINFFIYVISGQQFRQQLRRMCQKRRRRFYIPASSPPQTERVYKKSLTKKPSSAI